MPNRLQYETSPYLLQHAQNPVDWYPWGEEAYQKARAVVAKFVGAAQAEEIIFTRNASESLNLVAYSYALSALKTGAGALS